MATYKCPQCGNNLMRSSTTPAGRQRWVCKSRTRGYCYSTTSPEVKAVLDQKGDAKTRRAPRFARKLAGVKRFVITAAQNATPVHPGFLKALEAYCKANGAELVVIPIRYKNPTSRWTASQQNAENWADEVRPHLYNQRKLLNDSMMLLGDIKTVPTASTPLSGFESLSRDKSAVVGHTKLQLVSIPTPQNLLPKLLTTTGAVTAKNYTDSKAGKKGEFHHTFAAAVVEVENAKRFHLRQLVAKDDGSFIDLDREYLPDGSTRKAKPALALVMGDTHYRCMDPKVKQATFGKGGIVAALDPQHLVWHDLLDGYSRNPHHRQNVFAELAKRQGALHMVEQEVRETVKFLCDMTGDRVSVVVPSNHNDFLARWIIDTDWKRDSDNAEFYLETALVMARQTRSTPQGFETPDPFAYWIERLKPAGVDIRCPTLRQGFRIADIEQLHGHQGPNGARGTVANLSRLGTKVISGHGHAAAIEGGHYRVGTNSYLNLEYNFGPSSWLHTDCVIYANGKRSLINIIDGRWRA